MFDVREEVGCEDLRESEAAEICVERYKNKEVFVQEPDEFP